MTHLSRTQTPVFVLALSPPMASTSAGQRVHKSLCVVDAGCRACKD